MRVHVFSNSGGFLHSINIGRGEKKLIIPLVCSWSVCVP